MIVEEYILKPHIFYISIYLLTVIPLIIYIIVLQKKVKIFDKKRSIIATQEELRKIFSFDEKEKVVRVKKTGRETAKRFDLVTVLFSDIQGFTKIAEELNPESLIDELDVFFYHFDSVVDKYNIEKIKTIGDAYMCAGGIPNENHTNPVEVVIAAIEIQQFMKEMKHKKGEMWDLRIGIHTGSVIAGVVGHKKITYDIWGDTVNTASRMESSSTPGRINISGHTYDFVKDYFICEYRGKMPVKYKGNIDMYYVNGIRPELKIKMKGLNTDLFTLKLQILRIYDLEKYILQQFERYSNPDLTYHNIKNTIDLYTHADLFARSENVTEADAIIILTTALLLNTGYLVSYENHLAESQRLTRNILPKFNYLPEQIEEVCSLMVKLSENKAPVSAKEGILLDAIYSYVGRADFEDIMKEMYKEEKLFNDVKLESWRVRQLQILDQFNYNTKAGATLREVTADKQIEKLKKMKL